MAQPILDGQSAESNSDWNEHHGTTWPFGYPDMGIEPVEADVHGNEPLGDGQFYTPSEEEIEEGRILTGAYPFAGIDILAFYKTFRRKALHPFPGMWGIFLIRPGLRSMTDQLADVRPGLPRPVLAALGREIVVAHEYFHFFIDVRALAMEGAGLAKPFPHHYLPYRKSVVDEPDLPQWNLEEALANHFAYSQLRYRHLPDGTRQGPLIAAVLEKGPIPYCDFRMSQAARAHTEGTLGLAIRASTSCSLVGYDLYQTDMEPDFFSVAMTPTSMHHPIAPLSACPIHNVRGIGVSGLLAPFGGPSHWEMRSFVEKYLQGDFKDRTDHDFVRIDNGEKVKFPNDHGTDLKSWEFTNILRKAGMRVPDYNSERQRTDKWRKRCPRAPAKPPI